MTAHEPIDRYGLDGEPLYAPTDLDRRLRALVDQVQSERDYAAAEVIDEAIVELTGYEYGRRLWPAFRDVIGQLGERAERRARE